MSNKKLIDRKPRPRCFPGGAVVTSPFRCGDLGSVNCPHIDECRSYPHKCGICRKNRRKRDWFEPHDYFEPILYPYPQTSPPMRWFISI